MLNYALIALLDISFYAIQPLFLAARHDAGGLGLAPVTIGTILGSLGFANGVIQVLCFPRAVKLLGARNLYAVGITSFVVMFSAFPVMHLIMGRAPTPEGVIPRGVWVVMGIQLSSCILANMASGEYAVVLHTLYQPTEN